MKIPIFEIACCHCHRSINKQITVQEYENYSCSTCSTLLRRFTCPNCDKMITMQQLDNKRYFWKTTDEYKLELYKIKGGDTQYWYYAYSPLYYKNDMLLPMENNITLLIYEYNYKTRMKEQYDTIYVLPNSMFQYVDNTWYPSLLAELNIFHSVMRFRHVTTKSHYPTFIDEFTCDNNDVEHVKKHFV